MSFDYELFLLTSILKSAHSAGGKAKNASIEQGELLFAWSVLAQFAANVFAKKTFHG